MTAPDPTGPGTHDPAGPLDEAVHAWLLRHGLVHHAPRFARERIGADVLADLTDAALLGIGIEAWGERRRILRAIEAWQEGGGRPDALPEAQAVPVAAERRQLTVMFCDLVDSTRLAASLDPEDFRAFLERFHRLVAATVSDWTGRVVQRLGDGALVYFGHPVAHEDDAIRAVHAARALVSGLQAVGDARFGAPGLRIGLATGLVVMGETGGAGLPSGVSASGSTPYLAARLQSVAGPNEILISDDCRRLLGESFELARFDGLSLKGFAAPMRAWKVLAERDGATRFALLRGAVAARLIGRTAERAMLQRFAGLALKRRGQVVLVSGEAGLGKSRLCEDFAFHAAAAGFEAISLQCSPYYSDTALYPAAATLLRRAAAPREDPVEDVAAARWTLPGTLDPAARGLLADWLDTQAGRATRASMQTDERKRLLDALVRWALALSETSPLLLLVEDAHWIDATTEAWLGELAARSRRHRILIVVTARPEYDAAWLSSSDASRLALSRLDPDEAAELVLAVAGEPAPDRAVVEAIVQRADGNPLFIEELTRAFSAAAAGGSHGEGLSAVPATLGDSLTARLDRLPRFRPLVQTASVVGREFSEHLLAAAADRPLDEVRDALRALADTGIVVAQSTGAPWAFRHALLRDAAYQSLLRPNRAAAHAAVARALESAPDGGTRPELLAHHHQEAGQAAAALEHWLRAGDRSAGEAAHREAIAHYRAAQRLLDAGTDPGRRPAVELRLLGRLGNALAQIEGFNSAAMQACFARARDLARQLGDVEGFVAASAAVGGVLCAQGRADEVEPLFEPLAPASLETLGARSRLARLSILGVAASFLGDLARAERVLERTCAEAIEEWPGAKRTPGLVFRNVNVLAYAAMTALRQGRIERALQRVRTAIEFAGPEAPNPALAYARAYSGTLLLEIDRVDDAAAAVREALRIAHAQGARPWLTLAGMVEAVVAIARGEIEAGAERFRAGIDRWHHEQGAFHVAEYCAFAADRLLRAGQARQAEELVRRAEDVERASADRSAAAEVLRLRGRLTELAGDWSAADACYRQAIAVADRQDADLHALRAVVALARLRLAGGHADEVVRLLEARVDATRVPRDLQPMRDALGLLHHARAAR